MTKVTSLALLLALTATAYAKTQAEIAEELNEEGKVLMYSNKFAEAARKFQEAVARVPEAKYFMNLCFARMQEGNYGDALTACNAVSLNNPTDAVKAKAEKLIVKIKETAKEQGIDLKPAGGGGGDTNVVPDPAHPPDPTRPPDPARPQPQPQPIRYAPAMGRPPAQNLSLAISPDNKYTWTLGVDLFAGGGQVGRADWYGSAAAGFRIKSDFLLDPAKRLGAQGYVQVNHLSKGNRQAGLIVDSLDIVDLGVAGYKHFCLGNTPRLCITPLAGVQVALMSPANDTDGLGSQVFNYAAVGGRGELSLAYAFGYRYEHVLQLSGGANVYSAVLSGPSDTMSSLGSAADVGLDKYGVVGYLGLGYTYRFNTPIGSSPFVTLE